MDPGHRLEDDCPFSGRRVSTDAGWWLNGDANPLGIIIRDLRGPAPAGLVTQPGDPQRLEAFHPLVDEAAADPNGARDVGDGSPLRHEQDDSTPSGQSRLDGSGALPRFQKGFVPWCQGDT